MRSRAETIVVALVATVAVSMVVVSAASADEWFIGGTKLSQISPHSAALATTFPVDEFATLSINPAGGATAEVKIKCEGANFSAVEPYISAGGGGMDKSLTFEKCKVTQPTTGCELEAEAGTKNLRKVTTNALGLTILLVGSPTKVSLHIGPLTKNVLASVPFVEGEACLGGTGSAPFIGSILILCSACATEAAVHAIMAQGSLENNSLEVAGDKAIIEGGLVLAKLASGANWSFHT